MEGVLWKKALVTGIIFLFIGITVAPSIYANVSKLSAHDELVDITTEIWGIKEVKSYTVNLSKEDADKVDCLFNSIKEQLDKAKTREDAAIIFNKAVLELNKFGLLPHDMSVEKIQKLVTGNHLSPKLMNILEKNYLTGYKSEENENFLCLIAGKSNGTSFFGPVNSIISWTIFPLFILGLELSNSSSLLIATIGNIILLLWILLWVIHFVALPLYMAIRNPLPILNTITFGGWEPLHYFPANGWVNTFGFSGAKSWEGTFYGNLPMIGIWLFFIPIEEFFTGAIGFTGIHIEDLYFGSALWVRTNSEPPPLKKL